METKEKTKKIPDKNYAVTSALSMSPSSWGGVSHKCSPIVPLFQALCHAIRRQIYRSKNIPHMDNPVPIQKVETLTNSFETLFVKVILLYTIWAK